MNNIVKKYTELDDRVFMTVNEAVELSRELAKRAVQTDIQFDEVVGIANGACLPTTIIAESLGLPFQMLRIRRKGSVVKNFLGRFSFVVRFFSVWYSIPVLNYPLVRVMGKMRNLADNDEDQNESRFKGKKNILIVDDALEFGSTIEAAQQIIKKDNPQCNTVVAVMSWAVLLPNETQVTHPDFFISRIVHHFPWSMNSPSYDEYQRWLGENNA